MSASRTVRTFRRGRIGRGILVAVLGTGAILAGAASSAEASVVCTGDTCVVVPDVVPTPLGPATISVTAGNIVTVHLAPVTPGVLVLGVPVALPPGPPNLPGYTRTTFASTGGVVFIDTIQIPPGPPGRVALPGIAVVSIHPPNPCRAVTTGTTVVFTPLIPPGPPA